MSTYLIKITLFSEAIKLMRRVSWFHILAVSFTSGLIEDNWIHLFDFAFPSVVIARVP